MEVAGHEKVQELADKLWNGKFECNGSFLSAGSNYCVVFDESLTSNKNFESEYRFWQRVRPKKQNYLQFNIWKQCSKVRFNNELILYFISTMIFSFAANQVF